MPYKDRAARLAYSKKWNEAHYKNNTEECKARVSKRKKEIIKWYTEYKKTLKCTYCDENSPTCLEFHHKDPKEKDFNVADKAREGYSKKTLLKEMDKCLVVCANCHRKIHAGIIKY